MRAQEHRSSRNAGTMSRRRFLTLSAAAVAAVPAGVSAKRMEDLKAICSGSLSSADQGFTLWQIPSHRDAIGNAYVIRTASGKIIVMDGGFETEAAFMASFLQNLGGKVDAWFISHPHRDHVGALRTILADYSDYHLEIAHIYHSRITDAQITSDRDLMQHNCCKAFYALVDGQFADITTDIQTAGGQYDFDDVHIRILSSHNPAILTNTYNNCSMVMRLWDKYTSVLFLGDAGAECGDSLIRGKYASLLNCDYVQMAHHGQSACSREFYNSFDFYACLWPTPTFVWNNDNGNGVDTGSLTTMETRRWMAAKGIREHHVTCLEGLYILHSAPHPSYDFSSANEARLFFDQLSVNNATAEAKVVDDVTEYTLSMSPSVPSTVPVTIDIYHLLYDLDEKALGYVFTFLFHNDSDLADLIVGFDNGERVENVHLLESSPALLASSSTWKLVSIDLSKIMKENYWGRKGHSIEMTFLSKSRSADVVVKEMQIRPAETSGIGGISSAESKVYVSGRNICAQGEERLMVFDTQGWLVGSGRRVTVAPGVYVAKTNSGTVKLSVR